MSNQITAIQEKNKRYLIEIDGLYHLFLYYRDIKSSKLKGVVEVNHILSEDELRYLNELVIQRGRRYIFNLLGQKDYSENQLRDKLKKGMYLDAHINLILSPFIEKAYVNDERLLERKIDGYKKSKSKREIEYKLLQKGFKKDEIRRISERQIHDEDEAQSAYQCLEKKYRMKIIKNEEIPEKDKMLAFLSRRGYSIEICLKVYKEFLTNLSKNDK
ncbi:MAG: regulatory protein RecX [Vallitaleaceae bacterium]|nr:regulatory protein RecX [Vallitaleaceae bacterium]